MDESTLRTWLAAFKAGDLKESDLVARLKELPYQDLDFAKVDHHRSLRRGFPEVIYGEGKDLEQIRAIAEKLREHGNTVLITRLSEPKIAALLAIWPQAQANYKARTLTIFREKTDKNVYPTGLEGDEVHSQRVGQTFLPDGDRPQGLVISAGTSDMAVAEEAAATLEAFEYPCDRIYDVGVAGLHRLMAHRERIARADAIAVVAGMEGALASVVGGLVEVPVIAVPTSVGYGASFGGLSALLGMLTGCAGGVAVVNIDNGFGAGYMLAMLLRNLERRAKLPE
ncbi:MAG: nickel pincer cofactor biosynthesis protein LarB [Candidatus Zixiibacteriota bacterium]|nr:MAG: nickel pincer cofactor biosynthesis protein LarB [candidate division Zixibacteria bacterium]